MASLKTLMSFFKHRKFQTILTLTDIHDISLHVRNGHVVRKHLRQKSYTERCVRTSFDDVFRFRSVHNNPATANICRVAKLRPDSLPLMHHLVRTLCAPASLVLMCEKCAFVGVNRLFHLVFECPLNDVGQFFSLK